MGRAAEKIAKLRRSSRRSRTISVGAQLALAKDEDESLNANLLPKESAPSDISDTAVSSDYGDSVDSTEEPAISVMDALKAAVVCMLAIAGASASISAIVAAPAIITYIAGGVCTVVAPAVAYREAVIVKIPGMRQLCNWLRDEAMQLSRENDRLSLEIDELEYQVGKVKDLEKKLTIITEKQGENVDSLVVLLKENGEIMEQMQRITKQVALQDIMKIVIASDENSDFYIDDEELALLTMKLQHQLFTHGIHLNGTKFEVSVKRGNRSVDGVLRLCEALFKDEEKVTVLPIGVHAGKESFDKEDGDLFVFEYQGSTRGTIHPGNLNLNDSDIRKITEGLGDIGDY